MTNFTIGTPPCRAYAHTVSISRASLDADDAAAGEFREAPGLIRRLARFTRRLGPAGPLAFIATTLPPIGAVLLLGLLAVAAPTLREAPMAPAACAVAFMVLGGLSILPTYAHSILAGWCFGFAAGFPTAISGIVGAALVGYAIARRASGQRLLAIIDEKPSWRAVHFALLGSGFWRAVWIITLLRVAPVPPFALTNLIMGAAHVKPGRFFVGTLLGMSPQAIVLSLGAAGLQQVSFRAGEQPWLIAGGIVALFVVTIVIGRLARRALQALAQEEDVAAA